MIARRTRCGVNAIVAAVVVYLDDNDGTGDPLDMTNIATCGGDIDRYIELLTYSYIYIQQR